jgi:hypothetical protein
VGIITSLPGKCDRNLLNLQPIGAKAKPYQVKQVRQVIVKYKLGGKEDAEV